MSDRSNLIPFPTIGKARELVMAGERQDAIARKLFGGITSNDPIERVPAPGTPTEEPIVPGGTRLPLVAASRQIPQIAYQFSNLVAQGAVLSPPYDPWLLLCQVDESESLKPSIEAYATNIGGFGIELEPLYPTEDPETGEPLEAPTEAQDEARRIRLFFAACNIDDGWVNTQFQVDYDTEATGNGYLEVLRDMEGLEQAVQHAPSYQMRLGELSGPILVEHPFRDPTTGELVTLQRYRRFRSFVQIRDNRCRYFKQYGDPRFINWKTGRYSTESWGVDEAGNSMDGTEVVHFDIYCPYSEYGVPRWIGSLAHARNGRLAAELVFSYFRDAPIGLKIALLAGGTFDKDKWNEALDRINRYSRGKDNAYSIVAIEVDPSENRDPVDDTRELPPRLSLEDLAWELDENLYKGSDSLMASSDRSVRRAFRLPPVYYGAAEEHTRAAVNAARATAEEQVFVPLRTSRWGHWFNTQLLPSMGINHWKVSLRGANTADDAEAAKALGPFVQGGGVTPNAMIHLLNELTGSEFERIAEPWADRPWALTELLLQSKLDPNKPVADLVEEAQELERQAAEEARARMEQLNNAPPAGDDDDDEEDEELAAKAAEALGYLELVAKTHANLQAQLESDGVEYFG